MASSYPQSLDSFETHQDNVAEVIHAEDVNNIGQAVGAVQTVLGINPQGTELTVAARLEALEAGGGGGVPDEIDGGDPTSTFDGTEIDGGTP